jgi:hypothetical protein
MEILNQSPLFVQFLKEHPLISVRGLEKQIGVKKGGIGHALTKNSKVNIPSKYWYDLCQILGDYGFEYPSVEIEETDFKPESVVLQ